MRQVSKLNRSSKGSFIGSEDDDDFFRYDPIQLRKKASVKKIKKTKKDQDLNEEAFERYNIATGPLF